MITFKKCLRLFRFYEALALYELYYRKLDDSLGRQSEPVFIEDRPITWVPLVFHGTNLKALTRILGDGQIRPSKCSQCVSLTELPITELSRLRSLGSRVSEVAIGFPRVVLEAKGLFQPAYLKHTSDIVKEAFRNLPKGYVEIDQDLGALHEVRVPGSIPLDDAVWILCSVRDEESKKVNDPVLLQCQERGIALSYWHPTHQQEMVQEPTFRKEYRDENGHLFSFESCGESYLPPSLKHEFVAVVGADSREIERMVILPDGNPFNLRFPSTAHMAKKTSVGWAGPYTKIDMAQFFINEIRNQFPAKATEIKTRVQF